MIKLDAFIRAIQDAVLRANEALIDRGQDSLVDKFFDAVDDDSPQLQDSLDGALSAIRDVKDRESLQKAAGALKKARDSLSGGEKGRANAKVPDSYRAKTVTVEYPVVVDGEIQFKDVHVPLVTLIPLNFSSIEEVKLKTDVELHADGDDLQITFGKVKSVSKWFKPKAPGNLEITIKPSEGTDGVKLIIDGYERVLRAQIPS